MTLDEADDQRAVLALAGILTATTATIATIAVGGLAWWALLVTAIVVGCGVSMMVWHGLVRPIRDRARAEQRARMDAEHALARRDRLEDAARRVDDAAALVTSETEVFDLLARAACAVAPGRQVRLLLVSSQEPTHVRW